MKKLISKVLLVLLSMIILLGHLNLFVFHNNVFEETIHAETNTPPYAKWGRLAMKETQARFPNADIIDYLHIGRDVHAKSSIEKFKLWLKENNKEFGVYVNIEFNNQTEKIIKIVYKETNR